MMTSVLKTLFPQFEEEETNAEEEDQSSWSSTTPDLSVISDLSQSTTEETGSLVTSQHDRLPMLKEDQVEHHPSSDPHFTSKEDQDVAVFLGLVERMSVKSLLFILQDHARSMHNIHQDHLQKVLERQEKKQEERKRRRQWLKDHPHPQGSSTPSSSSSTRPKSKRRGSTGGSLRAKLRELAPPLSPFSVKKKFRFAEIMGGQQVRTTVYEIPPVQDHEKNDFWWTEGDMVRMIKNALRVVRHYKKNRPDYVESITVLAESYKSDLEPREVERYMKKLSADSVARGLEPHLLKSLTTCRIKSIDVVLDEQEKFRRQQQQQQQPVDSSQQATKAFAAQVQAEAVADRIRRRYRKSSQLCRTLALKMAEWDHVEALKSSLSSWGMPPPAPTHRKSSSSSPSSSRSSPSSSPRKQPSSPHRKHPSSPNRRKQPASSPHRNQPPSAPVTPTKRIDRWSSHG